MELTAAVETPLTENAAEDVFLKGRSWAFLQQIDVPLEQCRVTNTEQKSQGSKKACGEYSLKLNAC